MDNIELFLKKRQKELAWLQWKIAIFPSMRRYWRDKFNQHKKEISNGKESTN